MYFNIIVKTSKQSCWTILLIGIFIYSIFYKNSKILAPNCPPSFDVLSTGLIVVNLATCVNGEKPKFFKSFDEEQECFGLFFA